MCFAFGRNWSDFIAHCFSEERVRESQRHLLHMLKRPNLEGMSFLDIGCGSGLHSLAAYLSGAERVISFDYDPDSVAATRRLHEYVGRPETWEIMQGSVLDRAFLDGLPRCDIVYSWGVLHHTGAMWEAVRNAASTMAPDGVFYIALYTTDVYVSPGPEFWLTVKKIYNTSWRPVQWLMETAYYLWVKRRALLARKSWNTPNTRGTSPPRGMSRRTDIRDWLGGWPMEFAGLQETKEFCSRELGLELVNILAGEANTEYVFRRRGARNYWDRILAEREMRALAPPFRHHGGNAWVAEVPEYADTADTDEAPRRSRLMLYEDDVPSGFAHAPVSHVVAHGRSRYAHRGGEVIFSTIDNTDPNTNGRTYAVCPDFL